MNNEKIIILLASFALAAGGGYWYIKKYCPTKKEKLAEISQQLEESLTIENIGEIETKDIPKIKKNLNEKEKELTKLKKKSSEKLEEGEEETLEKLPILLEVQEIVKEVNKKEDLDKKVINTWNYVYCGMIVLGIFFLAGAIISYLVGLIKKGEE